MPAITFQNYKVVRLSYERKGANEGKEIKLSPQLFSDIKINEDTKSATVILEVRLKPNEVFDLDVKIEGYFSYSKVEDEKEIGFASFLKTNGVAILYPYLRSIVSTVTGLSNEFPQLILPTINVAKALEDQKNED